MALGLLLGIGRTFRKKSTACLDILTAKRGPRNYYKGKNCKPTGFHTHKGGYVLVQEKLPSYVVPELTGCQATGSFHLDHWSSKNFLDSMKYAPFSLTIAFFRICPLYCHRRGALEQRVKLLPCDQEVTVQPLETASGRNARNVIGGGDQISESNFDRS
ncbi:hypothetical protein BC332_22989 [Capsicum chinense]|nr:hypothetical protein BC332_22989 [Capsicum chinense]